MITLFILLIVVVNVCLILSFLGKLFKKAIKTLNSSHKAKKTKEDVEITVDARSMYIWINYNGIQQAIKKKLNINTIDDLIRDLKNEKNKMLRG